MFIRKTLLAVALIAICNIVAAQTLCLDPKKPFDESEALGMSKCVRPF